MSIYIHNITSQYSRTARLNTGYVRPGSYEYHKEKIFEETQDFIKKANESRMRLQQQVNKGAKVLPCLI